MRLRPTSRGAGLAVAGLGTVLTGVLLGAVDLVRIGTLATLVVVGAAVGVALLDPGRGRHRLAVRRLTTPNPVHAGSPATVRVEVTATDPAGRVRLAGLRLGEQASSQLSGGRPMRARVTRSPRQVALSYPITPQVRGRWPLGPLLVTRSDPFGVVRATASLGEPAEVVVWPEVRDLPVPRGALVGEPDRVALGARSPSPDDAALRDYRLGDDLRRVHWASSARRGGLMVRSDERAGLRPVTVLLDLPSRPVSLEWNISLASSMALAMLDAGHPVRMLAGPSSAWLNGTGAAFVHQHGTGGGTARAEILDGTLDLECPDGPVRAEDDLLAAAQMLTGPDSAGEIVLALLGPLTPRTRAALSHVADAAQGWAMVRTTEGTGAQLRDADDTVLALRRAGWRACPVSPGEDLGSSWLRLLGSAR